MAWEYLDGIEKERCRIIADYLQGKSDNCVVVDLNCGKAPLRKYIKYKKYLANDIIPQDFEGFYHLRDDEFAEILKECDILAAMGYGGYEISREPIESPTVLQSIQKILDKLSPQIFIFETIEEYEPLISLLNLKNYDLDLTVRKHLGESRVLKRAAKFFTRKKSAS